MMGAVKVMTMSGPHTRQSYAEGDNPLIVINPKGAPGKDMTCSASNIESSSKFTMNPMLTRMMNWKTVVMNLVRERNTRGDWWQYRILQKP